MGISMGDGRYFENDVAFTLDQHRQQTDILNRQTEAANQAWLSMHPVDRWLWVKQNVT
jgi:hypothetical protein